MLTFVNHSIREGWGEKKQEKKGICAISNKTHNYFSQLLLHFKYVIMFLETQNKEHLEFLGLKNAVFAFEGIS